MTNPRPEPEPLPVEEVSEEDGAYVDFDLGGDFSEGIIIEGDE